MASKVELLFLHWKNHLQCFNSSLCAEFPSPISAITIPLRFLIFNIQSTGAIFVSALHLLSQWKTEHLPWTEFFPCAPSPPYFHHTPVQALIASPAEQSLSLGFSTALSVSPRFHACLRACSVAQSYLILWDPTDCGPWNFPGKNIGVGCHLLFHLLPNILQNSSTQICKYSSPQYNGFFVACCMQQFPLSKFQGS